MNERKWDGVCLELLDRLEYSISQCDFDKVIREAIDKDIAGLRKIIGEIE